jgi:ubiquinone/menaquinone biosynthesis C-methylase UbiE
MAQAGAVCTGIDISASSIEAARESARAAGVSISFEQADMEALPEFNAPFDLITCCYALYYASDAAAVLRRAQSLLSLTGTIAIFGPYDDNNREWFDFIAPFLSLNERVVRSTTRFMPDEVLDYAIHHFERVTCERFINAISIPSLAELRRYWRSNIYYDEAVDPAFDAAARAHFKIHKTFDYRKVGQLILMRQPFG